MVIVLIICWFIVCADVNCVWICLVFYIFFLVSILLSGVLVDIWVVRVVCWLSYFLGMLFY